MTQEIGSPETERREYDRLTAFFDNYPKYVLRTDEFAGGNYKGVETMHVADFLLNDNDISARDQIYQTGICNMFSLTAPGWGQRQITAPVPLFLSGILSSTVKAAV